MQPNKEAYFSLGEREWIDKLQDMFGINYIDAVQYVIEYKREMAFMYKQQGHHQMFCQIMDELGELTPEMEQAEAPGNQKHYKQIIVDNNDVQTPQNDDEAPKIITKD